MELNKKQLGRFNFEKRAGIRDRQSGKVHPQYRHEILPIEGFDDYKLTIKDIERSKNPDKKAEDKEVKKDQLKGEKEGDKKMKERLKKSK